MKNNRIAKGFDRLASVYQRLSKIVFGKSLEQAQQYNLNFIKSGDRVLILGGGSGYFLKSLLDRQVHMTVDYIDISEKMIQLARDKTKNPQHVNFIVGTEQNIPDRTYTVVITNFYLDLFADNTLQHVIQKIKAHITADAQWLVTDFVSQKWWHNIMLWCMYRFFNLITHIEARTLPDWQSVLKKDGFIETESKKFYRGFIKSVAMKQ